MAPSKEEQMLHGCDLKSERDSSEEKGHTVVADNVLRQRKEASQDTDATTKWADADIHWKLQNGISDVVKDVKESEEHVDIFVAAKELPSWSKLNSEINKIVEQSSWWDLHGVDWLHVLITIPMFTCGLLLLKIGGFFAPILGVVLMGFSHAIWSNKVSHIAVHNGMADSKNVNKALLLVCIEALGGFSMDMGHDTHIKYHHPHTNIIGLGDSSVWKMPALPRLVYMFIAPVLLPLGAPIVSIQHLVINQYWFSIVRFLTLFAAGTAFIIWLLMEVSGFSFGAACVMCFVYRGVLGVPYIHVNIFQHIGLPMWDEKHRPARIYQMASGCLNLDHNIILDHCFGHSLISCHIEHHLFPRLSDNMCLKVRPLVRSYLKEAGLPYTETSYFERLCAFLQRYDELMVDAPPITHFIGIQ